MYAKARPDHLGYVKALAHWTSKPSHLEKRLQAWSLPNKYQSPHSDPVLRNDLPDWRNQGHTACTTRKNHKPHDIASWGKGRVSTHSQRPSSSQTLRSTAAEAFRPWPLWSSVTWRGGEGLRGGRTRTQGDTLQAANRLKRPSVQKSVTAKATWANRAEELHSSTGNSRCTKLENFEQKQSQLWVKSEILKW